MLAKVLFCISIMSVIHTTEQFLSLHPKATSRFHSFLQDVYVCVEDLYVDYLHVLASARLAAVHAGRPAGSLQCFSVIPVRKICTCRYVCCDTGQ